MSHPHDCCSILASPTARAASHYTGMMRWSAADIADAVEAGLKRQAAQDDLEQAVYGFDHLAELGLHPLIHDALRHAGWGVWPEQRYPADWLKSRRSEGKRCDVVLTPNETDKGLRQPQVKDTLFDTPELTDPEAACWIEIKTVAQFEIGGPFRRYTQELLSPVAADVKKLWTDGGICHAGLLVVLFTQSQEVADHDLGVWMRKCLERGYPVATPATRGFRITDRLGNAWCAVALVPVRGG
ncbi:MAG: hypothetical protein IT440_14340 [Phycisphaeraceae bacterium]|nr:hypothetical protein [Phycisphaeraceae bacterium]